LIIFTGQSIDYFKSFVGVKGVNARLALPASIPSALQLAANFSRSGNRSAARFGTLVRSEMFV
jgi:hypothetical protein